MSPGPGAFTLSFCKCLVAYNHLKLTGNEGYKQSMGSKPSDDLKKGRSIGIPGPGQYTPNINIGSKSPPRAKFGNA